MNKPDKSSTQSQAKSSTSKRDFLIEKNQDKALKTGRSDFYLVVDIGNYLIKYSIYGVYDFSRVYLLSFELKDASKIVEEGQVNHNLFKRDLERKLNSLSELATDFRVIIIPPKNSIMSKPLPSMELKDKKAEMIKDIKSEFRDIQTADGIYDWSTLNVDQSNDTSSVYLESISSITLFPILTALVDLKVKDYKVVSPVLSTIPLTEYYEGVSMVVDLGHSSVTSVIVKDGVIMQVGTTSAAGKEMNSKFNIPISDIIKVKHSSLISELPTTVNAVFETLKAEIIRNIEDYNKMSIDKVEHIIINGGHANTDIENLLGMDALRIPIKHVDMDIENADIIPREVKNYLYQGYGALMNEVDSYYKEEHDHLDYSAPKDSMIMKIKKVAQFFNNNRVPFIGFTASALLAIGIMSFGAQKVNEVSASYENKLTDVTSEVASLSEQVTAINTSYDNLMTSTSDFSEDENVGKLLQYITDITPPNFTVKEFTINSNSNTGVMKVTSESELITSTFLTLLQDPERGAFQKANIVKVEVKDVSDRKYYETHLFLEGRKY